MNSINVNELVVNSNIANNLEGITGITRW